jgi:hypothetical protein
MVWPTEDALLAAVVRPEQRSSAFAVHHALLNFGFGVGGLAAAALVRESSAGSSSVSTASPPMSSTCW